MTKDWDCSDDVDCGCEPRCSVGVVTADCVTLTWGSTGEVELPFRVGDGESWRHWVEGASRRVGADTLERSEEGGERLWTRSEG